VRGAIDLHQRRALREIDAQKQGAGAKLEPRDERRYQLGGSRALARLGVFSEVRKQARSLLSSATDRDDEVGDAIDLRQD
jgi:hypothetical protein